MAELGGLTTQLVTLETTKLERNRILLTDQTAYSIS